MNYALTPIPSKSVLARTLSGAWLGLLACQLLWGLAVAQTSAGPATSTAVAQDPPRPVRTPEELQRIRANNQFQREEMERERAKYKQLDALKESRFDPNVRENAPPAYFPNSSIPPQEPPPVAQTHGLDLSQFSKQLAEAYFKWLCANDAGDYIFRKIEGVESVFEMRPREVYDQSWPWRGRYFLEDPVGGFHFNANPNTRWPEEQGMFKEPLGNFKKFQYWYEKGASGTPYDHYVPQFGYENLEMQARRIDQARYGPGRIVRFTRVWPTHPEYDRDEEGNIRMFQNRKYLGAPYSSEKYLHSFDKNFYSIYVDDFQLALKRMGKIPPVVEMSNKVRSRYGYTWRGISRSQYDRELGIAGNEVLVYDLKDNSLLGVRRSFAFADIKFGNPPMHDFVWEFSKVCPSEKSIFHKKVLPPPNPYTHVREEEIQKY